MQLFDFSGGNERLPLANHSLAEEVTLTPGDDPQSIRFYGPDRGPFGITRMLLTVFIAGDTPLDGQEASGVTVTLKELSGQDTVFEDVIGQSIKSLFRFRSLQIPQVIQRNQFLEVTVNATGPLGIADDTEHRVQITLIGLRERQLEERRRQIRQRLGVDEIPERHWVYAPATEIPAQTKHEPVKLLTDPVDGFFRGYAASNEGLSVNSAVRLSTQSEDLAPSIRLDTLEGDYLTRPNRYTFQHKPFEPLYAEYTNRAATATRHSFLADALDQSVLDRLHGGGAVSQKARL